MKIFSIFRWYFNLHLKNTMPTTNSGVNLPKCVRNMTILDKSKFDTDITVPIIHLRQAHVSDVMPYLKKYGLRIRHLKPLQTCTDNNQKYMLLNRNIQTYSAMDECDREGLKKHSITEENFDTVNLRLTYDNFHADEIFRAILPENQDGFSSFSQVGHIIHLNLREHLLPFKSIIGEVLLEKTPRTRTVVNKVDMIENTYRNFQMEIICGDPDMTVQLKENRCQFEFDFSQVYWNPRLSTEHERIVDSLSKDDVVFDVFAGVGPFSIPAAKKGCIVYANDLNPESYKWLLHNARKNKVNLSAYNKDGRDFIREDLKDQLIKYVNKQNITIIMNLPALAVEFLGGFLKLYDGNEIGDLHKPPILHVYCFTKGEDVTGIAKKLITEQFKFDVEDKILNIFRVRTVSNFKEMVRVTIKLDKEILTNENVKRSCSPSLDNASKKSVYLIVVILHLKPNFLQVVMGKKNKTKQIKNVIKVVGGRSGKSKNKAKPVSGHLKRINFQNKSKILEIDKHLVEFHDRLQKNSSTEAKTSEPVKKLEEDISKNVEDFVNLERASEETIVELEDMQL